MKARYRIYLYALVFLMKNFASAKDIHPFIDDQGYIRLATSWGLCGSVVIKPLPQPVLSQQNLKDMQIELHASLLIDDTHVSKKLGSTILDNAGVKVAYRWGINFRRSSHYRIACTVKGTTSTGNIITEQVPCQHVVSIQDIKHNVPCVVGAKGPGGSFDPLGMK